MTAADVLADLAAAGVRLTLTGDRLGFEAPAGAMTPERRAAVAAHRAAILAHLAPVLPTPGPDPRADYDARAAANAAGGLVGAYGAVPAGRLLLALQAWEAKRGDRDAEAAAYFAAVDQAEADRLTSPPAPWPPVPKPAIAAGGAR